MIAGVVLARSPPNIFWGRPQLKGFWYTTQFGTLRKLLYDKYVEINGTI